jgi:hypothetical protein
MNETVNGYAVSREVRAQASEERIEMWVELRGVDAELASVFRFYTSVDWYPKHHKEPTGIPMHVRISYGRHYPGQQYRQTIPRYSTDEEAFKVLAGRAKVFGTYDLSKQLLLDEGQDEATATLRQKCLAILKARKAQLQGRC